MRHLTKLSYALLAVEAMKKNFMLRGKDKKHLDALIGMAKGKQTFSKCSTLKAIPIEFAIFKFRFQSKKSFLNKQHAINFKYFSATSCAIYC